jgi:hypothetical protein
MCSRHHDIGHVWKQEDLMNPKKNEEKPMEAKEVWGIILVEKDKIKEIEEIGEEEILKDAIEVQKMVVPTSEGKMEKEKSKNFYGLTPKSFPFQIAIIQRKVWIE